MSFVMILLLLSRGAGRLMKAMVTSDIPKALASEAPLPPPQAVCNKKAALKLSSLMVNITVFQSRRFRNIRTSPYVY